jgi:hypothetical protein
MDRHLIYPPGWDFKKRESTWDADPSLKGCMSFLAVFLAPTNKIFAGNLCLFKVLALRWTRPKSWMLG